MKVKLILLTLLSIALVACGSDPKTKIVGLWTIDSKSVKSAYFDRLMANRENAGLIQKSLDTTVYTFNADGTFSLTSEAGMGAQTGKWKLVGQDLQLNIDKLPPQKEMPKFTVNADASKIHVSLGGDRGVELDLVKKQG